MSPAERRRLTLAHLAGPFIILLVIAQQGFGFALLAALTGLAVALVLMWRRSSHMASDALGTDLADLSSPDGSLFPGQLSITTSSLVWIPRGASEKQGCPSLAADIGDLRSITLRGNGKSRLLRKVDMIAKTV